MYTLFIDTHLYDIIIILLKNGAFVDKCEVINKKNNSEYIFPSIVKVIDGIKLDEIIVVNGPGSFTGVRLGVTIAKTLSYTLGIPIKTITSLEVMHLSNNSSKVALGDSNGYYLACFDSNHNLLEDYTYVRDLPSSAYDTKYNINIEKVYEYLKGKDPLNAHLVNPIYIKKIGVEIDKKSQN